MRKLNGILIALLILFTAGTLGLSLTAQSTGAAAPPVVLHAPPLPEIQTGKIVSPGEVLVEGDRIASVGTSVPHPAGAKIIDLGDRTLMPGMIDAHIHLFLHPGAEDMQTVRESVPERTILATLAARADLMAGFTAERDMGTEGAGSASTAVRNLINEGQIPGPRLRVCANAISILGGHEDAIAFNPALHIPSNADYANSIDQLVEVIREQVKEGADFIKIYQTGRDHFVDGKFVTPYQYTEAQLAAAVAEAAVIGREDPVTGQAIFAFVTLRGGKEGSEDLSRELREHVVSDRQRDSHAVGPHAPPAIGEVPEEQRQALVDAPQIRDRKLQPKPVRAPDGALHDCRHQLQSGRFGGLLAGAHRHTLADA